LRVDAIFDTMLMIIGGCPSRFAWV